MIWSVQFLFSVSLALVGAVPAVVQSGQRSANNDTYSQNLAWHRTTEHHHQLWFPETVTCTYRTSDPSFTTDKPFTAYDLIDKVDYSTPTFLTENHNDCLGHIQCFRRTEAINGDMRHVQKFDFKVKDHSTHKDLQVVQFDAMYVLDYIFTTDTPERNDCTISTTWIERLTGDHGGLIYETRHDKAPPALTQ